MNDTATTARTIVTAMGSKRSHIAAADRNQFGQYVPVCGGVSSHLLLPSADTAPTCPRCRKVA